MRATIDLDGENKFDSTVKMLTTYFNIKYFFKDAQIRVDLTRKGYHLVVWVKSMKQKDMLVFRACFSDDSIRNMLDSSRDNALTKNVLWTDKRGWRVRKDISVLGDNSPFPFQSKHAF